MVQLQSNRRRNPFAEAIGRKGANLERLADRVAEQPEVLPEVLRGVGADKARIKLGCSKVLRCVSQKNPEILYPCFDFFAVQLGSRNHFLKWDAVRIIANLAAIDSDRKLDPLLDRYLRPIRGPVMITAANVIAGATFIVLARPDLADRIGNAVLKVERAEYQTAECRNVAIGHAIESLHRFFGLLGTREKAIVLRFVHRQLANRRNATRQKATAFLKRHEPAKKSFQPD